MPVHRVYIPLRDGGGGNRCRQQINSKYVLCQVIIKAMKESKQVKETEVA